MKPKAYRYKLILCYDGTSYSGWQTQPGSISIQEIIEDKLKILLREPASITGAGRTDAGVHAIGQVAHFDYPEELDLYKTQGSLNGLLPKDIRIKSIEPVDPNFHARKSAINKEYHYHLNLSAIQDPFNRLYSWHLLDNLDLNLMQEGANSLLGTHDFSSFANEAHKGAAATNPVRTINRIDIVEEREGIRLEFEGKSFLYKMVRNLTGTLVDVARKKISLTMLSEILKSKNRRNAGKAAPAKGLFLYRVDYPKDL